jgi:ribosomal protein S18 acetylase RimI-like enzyme
MTVDQVTLRPYRPEDVPALHQIDAEFQREVDLGLPGRPPIYHHEDLDDIEGVYLNDGGAFWVIAGPNAEIAGYGGVLRVDEHTARLRRFRVRRSWRRRGLATMLLLEAERFCAERGYRNVTLGTTDVQQAAQALYRKHGYVEAGERWLRDDLREIEFAKELA